MEAESYFFFKFKLNLVAGNQKKKGRAVFYYVEFGLKVLPELLDLFRIAGRGMRHRSVAEVMVPASRALGFTPADICSEDTT